MDSKHYIHDYYLAMHVELLFKNCDTVVMAQVCMERLIHSY